MFGRMIELSSSQLLVEERTKNAVRRKTLLLIQHRACHHSHVLESSRP